MATAVVDLPVVSPQGPALLWRAKEGGRVREVAASRDLPIYFACVPWARLSGGVLGRENRAGILTCLGIFDIWKN